MSSSLPSPTFYQDLHQTNFSEFLLRELWYAYDCARKGKRNTYDEHQFELNDIANLRALRDAIIRREYTPSRGVAFIVRDPVIREIVAAPFRDRVVHHLLFNFCGDWWDRHFIADSYSCRKGKGTLYGQQRLAHHVAQVTRNFTEPAFVIKLDILGYFMSLNHDLLYQRVLWGLDREFPTPATRTTLYHTLKFLWYQIIHDQPMRDIIIRGKRSDWRDLPAEKSLFNQPKNRGIVIGNLTSQLLSNIFLDQLDRFVTFDLGYKHYGRYVDDFFILVPAQQKAQLLRDIPVIKTFLRTELSLTLHPRKHYAQPIERGIPFVGSVIYPRFITVGRRTRHKSFRAAYEFATTGYGSTEQLISRMGTVSHINSRHFFKKIYDTFGWRYL